MYGVRHGYQVRFAENAIILRKNDREMILSKAQYVQVPIIMLRPLPQTPHAAEVKRLYVRPKFRGLHLASALMRAAEEHARLAGIQWFYLDTKDDLHAAIRFYLGSGYQPCPRYNDNPQATLFLRKQL